MVPSKMKYLHLWFENKILDIKPGVKTGLDPTLYWMLADVPKLAPIVYFFNPDWPISADCWSPITANKGISEVRKFPYSYLTGLMGGRHSIGTSNKSKVNLDHPPEWRSYISVRPAMDSSIAAFPVIAWTINALKGPK